MFTLVGDGGGRVEKSGDRAGLVGCELVIEVVAGSEA